MTDQPAVTPTDTSEPRTEAGPYCVRCGHEPHDERDDPRCPAIAAANWSGGMPEPEYCECVDVDRLYVRMREAEAAASRPAALDVFTPWLALAIDDHALAYPATDSLHYDGVCSSDCAGDIARRYARLASGAKP